MMNIFLIELWYVGVFEHKVEAMSVTSSSIMHLVTLEL